MAFGFVGGGSFSICAAMPLAQESVFLSELQQQFSSIPSNSLEGGSFQTSRSLFFPFI